MWQQWVDFWGNKYLAGIMLVIVLLVTTVYVAYVD